MKLRELRKKQGMTLEAVAQIVETDVGHLSRVEREETAPGLALARRLAGLYEVSVDEIVGGSIPPKPQGEPADEVGASSAQPNDAAA